MTLNERFELASKRRLISSSAIGLDLVNYYISSNKKYCSVSQTLQSLKRNAVSMQAFP